MVGGLSLNVNTQVLQSDCKKKSDKILLLSLETTDNSITRLNNFKVCKFYMYYY